jgi:hypothetical protein
MHLLRLLAVAVAAVTGLTPLHAAEGPRSGLTPRRPGPALLDVVAPAFRDAVGQVLRQPTLTARADETEFFAHPNVYDWLLEHPDRAALAWRRMKVPCVEITDRGGRFTWSDGNGSDLAWQTVGRFKDGIVWYATGQVKPGPLLPTAPVKAVAVLHAPRETDPKGAVAELKPTLSVYLLTESKTAAAMVRMLGPAAPRMAEQGAEQLLLFFSGPARYIHRHPERAKDLLAPPAAADPKPR